MPAALGRERFLENPFYVLGLRPDCSRTEMEREGQKLLAMLELKLSAAASYATPLGPVERTPEKVRMAMAELRDPKRRLEHELWATLEPTVGTAPTSETAPGPAPWPQARRKLGWSAT
jgi:hypothetical protein